VISQNSEIHRIQHAFRAAMGALARPGTVGVLPLRGDATPTGLDASLDTLVRMFVDQAVTFAYLGDAVRERAIASETRSRAAGAAQAAFVVVPHEATDPTVAYAVEKATPGTLILPDKGATVLIGCDGLSQEPQEGMFGFAVSGPGVAGEARFYAASDVWQRARETRGDEYPCGIEIVLADKAGRIVAIPRSSEVVALGACASRGEVR
jgi:alpha-D-ribose 1-methylphosphonate 5-triphosphate synthase subunit PhnH